MLRRSDWVSGDRREGRLLPGKGRPFPYKLSYFRLLRRSHAMKMVGMPTSAYSAGVLRKIGWKGEPGRRYKRRPDGQIPRSIPQGGVALRRHYARTTAVVDLKHAALRSYLPR